VIQTSLPIDATGPTTKGGVARLHRAYPDLHITIEDLIEDGTRSSAATRLPGPTRANTWASHQPANPSRTTRSSSSASRPHESPRLGGSSTSSPGWNSSVCFPRREADRVRSGDRHSKFYELSDNLESQRTRPSWSSFDAPPYGASPGWPTGPDQRTLSQTQHNSAERRAGRGPGRELRMLIKPKVHASRHLHPRLGGAASACCWYRAMEVTVPWQCRHSIGRYFSV
jgi:hypothetical protein